jgi:hypothetical protein
MIRVEVTPNRLFAGRDTELTIRLTNVGTGPCTSVVFKLKLPGEIACLLGRTRVEVDRIAPGGTVEHHLGVRALAAGQWVATSTNFSYRNHHGVPCRESAFSLPLTVEPAPAAAPEPRLTVRLGTGQLPYDEWAAVQGTVHNSGETSITQGQLSISGPFEGYQHVSDWEFGPLTPGETADFSFPVRAGARGLLPVRISTAFSDVYGRSRRQAQTATIRVAASGADSTPENVRVLYLSANPIGTRTLRLQQELRKIRETVRLGKYRDSIHLRDCPAARIEDFSQALLDTSPRIVHFSGHGAPDGRIYFENEVGAPSFGSIEGLADLLRQFADSIECVIVNACDSEDLARAVSRHVDYVIGMRQEILDQASIKFSIGFYQALAAGRPIEAAFELGRNQVWAHDNLGDSYRTPLLLKRNAQDAGR